DPGARGQPHRVRPRPGVLRRPVLRRHGLLGTAPRVLQRHRHLPHRRWPDRDHGAGTGRVLPWPVMASPTDLLVRPGRHHLTSTVELLTSPTTTHGLTH